MAWLMIGMLVYFLILGLVLAFFHGCSLSERKAAEND